MYYDVETYDIFKVNISSAVANNNLQKLQSLVEQFMRSVDKIERGEEKRTERGEEKRIERGEEKRIEIGRGETFKAHIRQEMWDKCLYYACLYHKPENNRLRMIKWSLDNGADVNNTTNGSTILYEFVISKTEYSGIPALLECFLSYPNIKLWTKSSHGRTALEFMVSNESEDRSGRTGLQYMLANESYKSWQSDNFGTSLFDILNNSSLMSQERCGNWMKCIQLFICNGARLGWPRKKIPQWIEDFMEARKLCKKAAVTVIGLNRFARSPVIKINNRDVLGLIGRYILVTQMNPYWVQESHRE